ncbi:TIGR04255 family protein [Geoalkalibacter halelectricus]|uniref:TIGR04255 family protein n=1 Tax=Geoalkalibacter halelectricus TaxID=2847045 RepID=A0ABY5ZMQ3_9BACT|nr:TIGR04255 family protein [Geoalkalibacter halelectricus]MDO3378547.1 TIGR04255 family protein [Geoalkalibacter halelectricus]UWZ80139.1 TIGR04255 family protein [Geoalkalibacter halelectricus]
MSHIKSPQKIVVDCGETFPHLARSPLVESVIDIRAHASAAFEESSVRAALEPQLSGFVFLDAHRAFEHELHIEGESPPRQTFRDLGFRGVRFQTADQKQIVQFNRDGFVYSRLEPYPDWNTFSQEGLRLWGIFSAMARPVEINRIGLRFINRIELPSGSFDLGDYIKPAPEPPRNFDLPFIGFMHQETFAVPGHSYFVNVVRTVQPPQAGSDKGPGLILDIDVFSTRVPTLDQGLPMRTLDEMRWLKNKVFFGSVTENAIRSFQ